MVVSIDKPVAKGVPQSQTADWGPLAKQLLPLHSALKCSVSAHCWTACRSHGRYHSFAEARMAAKGG